MTKHSRPLVILSNDDGVEARGLRLMAAALSGRFDLLVVAPSEERSASSHVVNMAAEWVIHHLGPERYAVVGSPADCVYVALCQLAPRPPSLVISGINSGYNLGTDVLYSGTVAAAAEGVILGVPAVAVSAQAGAPEEALQRAARFTAVLSTWIHERGWRPADTLLNVNVPAEGSDAFEVGAMGKRRYPRAARLPGPIVSGARLRLERPRLSGSDGCEGEDAEIVRRGHISVAPLRLDWTDRDEVFNLSEVMCLDGFAASGRGQG